ncbi:MAG: carboxylating nicotinate-nucleotide diphosphorylase [Actinomycetia bacterium]|nr:carboxylating nicotinate-nucleotide diphosphorylase [Actinomycetes bacterium]
MVESSGLGVGHVVSRVTAALDEDLAYGPDVTTVATVPADQRVVSAVSARKSGVLAGLPIALVAFDLVIGAGHWRRLEHRNDGSVLHVGDDALKLEAPTRGLLTAERTALNFLGHLSGVATVTAVWAARVAPARIRDTRKTIPGLRVLDKYAVRCGGGVNHRMGLGDAALIKDNHVAAAGSVRAAIAAVRAQAPSVPLEVECDRAAQVSEAMAAGADLILLDNMTIDQMRDCVALGQSSGRPVQFEASGGLTLENASAVAGTGVDFVAVGALTHSAPVLDLGLDVLHVVDPSVGSSGD